MASTVKVGRRNLTVTVHMVDIEGLSSDNPCQVTWTGHGLSTGDRVSFADIQQTGWTALNGNSYPVTVVSANAFTIPFDASSLGSYNPTTDPGRVGHDVDLTSVAVKLSAVGLYSSAANDRVVLRDDGPNGVVFFAKRDSNGGGFVQGVGGESLSRRIYVKASDLSLSDPSRATIFLEFD